MEPVKVPQYLELEDVLAWGLAAADLVALGAGLALAWWLYLEVPEPFILRVAIALPTAAAGLVFGVARVGERPVREWLALVIAFGLRARVLVSGDPSR